MSELTPIDSELTDVGESHGSAATSTDGLDRSSLLRRIADARNRLIDRNLRNRLISTPLDSTRSKSIRVFGELSDQIFDVLVATKRAMTFLPVEEGGEVEEGVDDAATSASEDLSYELALPENSDRQSDNALQTKLSNASLSKRLLSIYYESRDYEEEQGVNVLYLACGFLQWFEDANSSVPRYAPLLLIPVELVRQTGKGGGFSLKVRDDEFLTNISLQVWLREQFSIDLPELPEEGEWSPSQYFGSVVSAISTQSRWTVLGDEILLGFFSFSKFLLWRDLDPATWPEGRGLIDHPLVQKLLRKSSERQERDLPLFDPEDSLDKHFSPRDLVYVLDADPSQTEAIQTALAGRDLVIQGPPGTGKSQTITNLIAAAVANGKSVLFMAEKMAALEVVHSRLVKAGIGEICLELHSRKANKKSVHEQLKTSIDPAPQPKPSMQKVDRLSETQTFLNKHAARVNSPLEPWGYTPFELLGCLCLFHEDGTKPLSSPIPNSNSYTRKTLDELRTEIEDLCGRLRSSGFPTYNPWVDGNFQVLTPLAAERVDEQVREANASSQSIRSRIEEIKSLLGTNLSDLLNYKRDDLEDLVSLAKLAGDFPVDCPLTLARSLPLRSRRAEVASLVSRLQRYTEDHQYVLNEIDAVWRKVDIENLRFRYKATGGSIFSIFNASYRQAGRELSALCMNPPPRSYRDRLAILDRLCGYSEAERELTNTDASLAGLIGPFWDGLKTQLMPVVSLVRWHEMTASLSEKSYEIATEFASVEEARLVALGLMSDLDRLFTATALLKVSLDIPNDLFNEMRFVDLERKVHGYLTNLDLMNYWPPSRNKLLEMRERIGEEMFKRIWDGEIELEKIAPTLTLTVCEVIWNEYARVLPELSDIDAHKLNGILSEFRSLDSARSKIAASEIKYEFFKQLPVGNAGEMGVIRTELLKKSRHKSLRKLMREAGGAIQKLKPVFLMSPLSVAQYLQPGSLMFDLIVIDEASQIRPEDALGAIARGTQIVVVGDQRQLPPTNFFNKLVDEDVTDDNDEEFALSDMESILSLSEIALPNHCMLTWHYRSLHPGLIEVSNRNFYESRLKLPPSTIRSSYSDGFGVSMVRSPANSYERGGSRGGTNTAEAELIAREVIAFARSHPKKSLGVAAFSVKQRDLIRELVEIQFTKNPDLKEFFSEGRAEPFFVKNLESIQGDERDAIFISVGYGRSSDGVLRKSFGPLAATGGERRLNVLISRAKERVTVFSSITADDFKSEPGKTGLNAFREFLQYAEKGYFEVSQDTDRSFDSDFEESVAVFLQSKGYAVSPQVGMSGFFIDLGVIHPDNPNSYLCGIECDGATYHSSRSARERDRLRQGILESRGWRIYRIWSTDWFYRRADQEKRLLDALAVMRGGGSVATPAPSEADAFLPEDPPPDEMAIESGQSITVEQDTVPYEEYSESRSSQTPIHLLPNKDVDSLVLAILKKEGPIHELEVGRRLARVYGLQKAGSRIQDATQRSLKRLQAMSSGNFWRIDGVPVRVRDRSEVESPSLLKAEMIPPEEILVAAAEIVQSSVRIGHDELVVSISRRFGFQRCGEDLNATISAVLKRADCHGFFRQDDGMYVAKD